MALIQKKNNMKFLKFNTNFEKIFTLFNVDWSLSSVS